MEGNELFNAAFPDLVSRNLMDLQDADGKYMIREELQELHTHDSCWQEYRWPRPGGNTPSLKQVYLEKATVGGETLIVGAGRYLPS